MILKKLLITFCFLAFGFYMGQNEFITVWKPANASEQNIAGGTVSTNTQIWFPGKGASFNVYWEENGFPAHNGTLTGISSTTHFLIDFGTPFNPNPTAATYHVKISDGNGSFDAIKFYNDTFIPPHIGIPVLLSPLGDFEKIIAVTQWGNINWQSMEAAFSDCINLDVTATDIPDLTNVTSTSLMFHNCSSLLANPTINFWNTSSVINMSHMFSSAGNFNQPLNSWNTANVTNMAWMFHYLTQFNQPLSNWDVSNVTSMLHMFHLCTEFNQDLSIWNVTNVENMTDLFAGATSFNQNLGDWNLQNVTAANNMLLNTGLSCSNYDRTLYDWSNNPNTVNNLSIGNVAPLQYKNPLAIAARSHLTTVKGWTITGDQLGGECESFLSVSETHDSAPVQLYPVPAEDFLHLLSAERIKKVTILDATGRLIDHKEENLSAIPISHLSSGIYIIIIDTGTSKTSKKFIKK